MTIQPATNPFTHVPKDVQKLIFQQLDPEDLSAVARTNRALQALVQDVGFWQPLAEEIGYRPQKVQSTENYFRDMTDYLAVLVKKNYWRDEFLVKLQDWDSIKAQASPAMSMKVIGGLLKYKKACGTYWLWGTLARCIREEEPKSLWDYKNLDEFSQQVQEGFSKWFQTHEEKSITAKSVTMYSEIWLPDVFWKLTNLEELRLYGHLSNQISRLKKLKLLSFCSGRTGILPKAVWALTGLKELHLVENSFDELPDELGNLTQLEKLNLNCNKFKHIPKCVGRLVNLKILFLFGNPLEKFPKFITRLPKLETLYVDEHQAARFPEYIKELSNKRINVRIW